VIRRFSTAIALCLLSLVGILPGANPPHPALAQQGPPVGTQPFADLLRIADDVYVWRYQGYSTMFIVTDDGVIAADPIGMTNPREPELYKAVIRSVTDQPVKYLIYSHGNEDHAWGGDAFADTATLIGTPEAARKLTALGSPRHPVPTTMVDPYLRLELGGVALDLYWAGHTQGDDHLIIHYPARGVLFAVDFIPVRSLPFRDLGGATDIDAWMDSLTWIEGLEWDILVPGHGFVLGDKGTVREVRQYLGDLQTAIRAARTQGLADNSEGMVASVREALAPSYGSWGQFNNWLDLNVSGVVRVWSGE